MATILRNARENKGLSQRDLGAVSGVPQSHISKIEKGAVDLRLSSLIELARALDLELVLVPRPAVPAVQSIVRSAASASDGKQARLALKDLSRFEETIARNRSASVFICRIAANRGFSHGRLFSGTSIASRFAPRPTAIAWYFGTLNCM